MSTDEPLESEADLPEDDVDGEYDPHTPRQLSFRIGKDLTSRLDKYVVDRVGYLSRAEVQKLIAEQLVTVNGKKAKASYKPRLGDMIAITARPPRGETIEPEDIPLQVVYEDEHLLAINKQADLIVHPARGRWHGTLVNGLMHYAKTWSTVRGPHRPGILHRLDRNTTGIMLVAKSDEAHWRMARQFETRTIQKTYMAIVHGVPELLAGLIDLPIGQDAYVKERQAVRKLSSGAKTAQTMYEVLESFPVTAETAGFKLQRGEHAHDQNHKVPPPGFSLLRLKPKTGRTHQLRVHTSFKGFPIIGDTMYGGRVVEYHTTGDDGHKQTRHLTRQALHAAEITFTHPRTLKKITLQAPLPPDMTAIADQLRAATGSGGESGTKPAETPEGVSDGVE